MQNYRMWIGGKLVEAESKKTYKVVNPATEEEFAQAPLGDKRDVDKAVEAASKAFPIWSKMPQAERSRILYLMADVLRKHIDELVEIDILDHAAPIRMTRTMGQSLANNFEHFAEISKVVMNEGESRLSNPNQLLIVKREPVGVCASITPWNVPINSTARIAWAIAVGNTCVLKPPSVDSLSTLKAAEILSTVAELPPGTANVITGPGSTVGQELVSHPAVGIISFTGSSEAGKSIMAAASPTMKHLIMECGGKNPFIVLEDADLDVTINQAVRASTMNTGMICGAPGRFYIHEKLHDKFVEGLIAGYKKIVVGDPNNEKTEMGPVVSAEHRDRVEGFIKSGIEQGAKLVLGGQRPNTPPLNKGYYIMPTIFTDVTPDMTIYREEIFGPVACVSKFSSEDEVIKLANDNVYGLNASVWTTDIARGMKFAHEIQAGTVSINDHIPGGAIWGGYKESGIGKAGQDTIALKEYTQIKEILINTTVKR
jgi:betaine-aldehyde dehydrogenase